MLWAKSLLTFIHLLIILTYLTFITSWVSCKLINEQIQQYDNDQLLLSNKSLLNVSNTTNHEDELQHPTASKIIAKCYIIIIVTNLLLLLRHIDMLCNIVRDSWQFYYIHWHYFEALYLLWALCINSYIYMLYYIVYPFEGLYILIMITLVIIDVGSPLAIVSTYFYYRMSWMEPATIALV